MLTNKSFWAKAKAFTLFTAMVSFIIIGIGVVVVQHISNSEQNYSQIISSLYRQQEMDAVKDLVRSDVLLTFNVLFRARIFQYYNARVDSALYEACVTANPPPSDVDCDSVSIKDGYQPVDLNENLDWELYKKDQMRELFFGHDSTDSDLRCGFAIWMADKILGQLNDYAGYVKGGQYYFRIYDYYLYKAYNPFCSVH